MAFYLQNRHIKMNTIPSFASISEAAFISILTQYYNGNLTLEDIKSSWSVGDKRKISLSAMAATGVGESHVAQEQYFTILDFNHDDLVTSINGKTKALLSVQLTKVLSDGTTGEVGYMNSTRTVSGGWGSCARRTWCNNVFKVALPSYIQSTIKQVKKPYCNSQTATTLSYSTDYVWLPSEGEWYKDKYSPQSTDPESPLVEGTQYELFSQTGGTADSWAAPNIVMSAGNTTTTGSKIQQFGRSIMASSTETSSSQYFIGASVQRSAPRTLLYADEQYGIAPCFCL